MIDRSIIDATAAKFAALDFSVENARVAEPEAEQARIAAAEARAHERIQEISVSVHSMSISSAEVADLLLAEGAAFDLKAPSRETLDSEPRGLEQGIGELMKRSRAAQIEIDSIRSQVKHKLIAAVEDLAQVLHAHAEVAAAQIGLCFAALQAIGAATGSVAPGRPIVRAVKERLLEADSLIRHQVMDVPPAIIDLLRVTASLGPAVRPALLTRVSL